MKNKGVAVLWLDLLEGLSWENDLGEEAEIQNGIQIQSISVPAVGIIPGQKICETEYRHPHNPPAIIAPDMKSGTNANLSLLASKHSGLPNLTADQLRWYMNELILWASSGALETEAQYFIERFISGDGSDYFSPVMSNAAKEKNTTKNFIKKFGNDLNNKLKTTNGNMNSISLIYYDKNEPNGRPIYNDSNTEGLRIMMNDTEYTKIHIQSYNFSPITKEWDGTFYIEVFDHFGLDTRI